MDARLAQLLEWLEPRKARWGLSPDSLRPASNDASFRRYFRLDAGRGTLIVMDAPPAHEDVRPFLHAQRVLAATGVTVPEVLEADEANGFLLLSDLGTTTYFDALVGPDGGDAAKAHPLVLDTLDALVAMQQGVPHDAFPPYDRQRLLAEMQLYPDWYVARHKNIVLSDEERGWLQQGFELLLANNLTQPQVVVHRDWHCRNLMVLPREGDGPRNPGIIDFQDAVIGPITYDLVSLLRDAYVHWDEEVQIDWAVRYWERARAAKLPVAADFGEFWRDFEWMGLQRHIKILGIFARLNYRDGKSRYLADLPLVLRHTIEAVSRYDALAPLARVLDRVEERSRGVGYTF